MTHTLTALFLLAAFAEAGPAQIVETAIPSDPVKLDTGQVSGLALPSGVHAYFGVPFAAPPVGSLRWREPQPVNGWKGIYHADRKMPECIQVLRPHNINHYFGEEATSENCLYLNVWAPAEAKPGAGLPVIVFIYGGGSTIGSSGMALYAGEEVAKNSAVFVNFNYRLGLLGFMAHPEATAESAHRQSGNYAYLDQIAALQWIQRNIAQFGGDPAKVVISGQSAGAGAVSLLQASPLAKGLFRGVVGMSGGTWGNGGQAASLETAEKVGLQLQLALKTKSLEDLRQVPADRILALQEEFQVGAAGGSIRTVAGNVDGYFLPAAPAQIFAAHKQNDVPALIGCTRDESGNDLKAAENLAADKTAAEKLYGKDAEAFLKLYPAASDSDVREMGSAAAREGMVQRSMRNWALAQAEYGTAPVYMYQFSRVHPYIPGAVIADHNTATIGAYHTSDVPYWFGTMDALNLIRPTRNWTAYDRDLSAKMMTALIAFADSGKPGKMPAWTVDTEAFVDLGDKIQHLTFNKERMDFMKTHPVAMGPPRRLTRD